MQAYLAVGSMCVVAALLCLVSGYLMAWAALRRPADTQPLADLTQLFLQVVRDRTCAQLAQKHPLQLGGGYMQQQLEQIRRVSLEEALSPRGETADSDGPSDDEDQPDSPRGLVGGPPLDALAHTDALVQVLDEQAEEILDE